MSNEYWAYDASGKYVERFIGPEDRWLEYAAKRDLTSGKAPKAIPKLTKWRATASVSRAAFCTNLMAAGLLPPIEAIAAARGEWPATFAKGLDGLSEAQAAAAQIEWAGAGTIRRNAPLLASLAAFARVPDEVVDQLCGWPG